MSNIVSGIARMAPTAPNSQAQMNTEMKTTRGEIFSPLPSTRGVMMLAPVPLMMA